MDTHRYWLLFDLFFLQRPVGQLQQNFFTGQMLFLMPNEHISFISASRLTLPEATP